MAETDPLGSHREWDAATYDRVADPMTRWGAVVLDRLSLAGDETVLDAGCGSGRVTEMLLERLPRGRVVALDASANMLGEARRRLALAGQRVEFVHADLLDLAPSMLGEDVPVDAVLSTATFHWVPDHDRLFTNLAAVLRPGGQLVAQCGGHGNIARLLAIARDLGEDRSGVWTYATPDETRARLEAAGFEAIEVWLHDEPTSFETADQLQEYLEAVCLRQTVEGHTRDEVAQFLAAVVRRMPDRVIDYVRLNITARRAG